MSRSCRTEWVKLYGLLTGHEAQADKAFAEEKSAFEEVKNSVRMKLIRNRKLWHFSISQAMGRQMSERVQTICRK